MVGHHLSKHLSNLASCKRYQHNANLKNNVLKTVAQRATERIGGVGRTGTVKYHRSFAGCQLFAHFVPVGVGVYNGGAV